MKWRHSDVMILLLVSHTNLPEIWYRQQRDLKLGRLIAYTQFHKIWRFQTPTIWNDSWWRRHCVFQSLCKTWPRHPTALKLCRLIAYPKLHKICKFENHVKRNDVIMMSLTKTIGICGPPRNQSNYKSFERSWWELSKNISFTKFERFC